MNGGYDLYEALPPRFEHTYLGDFRFERMYPMLVGSRGLALVGSNGHGGVCILAAFNPQTGTFLPIPRYQTTPVGKVLDLREVGVAERRAAEYQNIMLVSQREWRAGA